MNFPAKFRDELGEAFIVAKAIDNNVKCLKVYSTADWNALSEKLNELPQNKTAPLLRGIFGTAEPAEPDKQGRIILPLYLRKYAEIESEVVVVGLGARAEIWSKANWEKATDDESMDMLVDIAEEIGF